MWGGCAQNFVFTAEAEQMRAPRQVCVGLIQNAIVLPTTKPFSEQKHAIMDRVTSLINAAGEAGVNVLCLQVPIVLPSRLRAFEGYLSERGYVLTFPMHLSACF